MTRDEALDLLPLLAGGELDEVTAAAAQRAAEEDPTLMAELESYRALDAALITAYAPDGAAPPATAHALALAEPQAPRLVVVRRRCPYCHDAIEAEALVVCAACATPHHAPCFEANEGCSLLGCGSGASIAASGPASVVCAGCARSTPQGAPFCAWCGADVAVDATPRHARPREEAPFDWRRYAAAAALLVASTFGVGGMFGVQQGQVLGASLMAYENSQTLNAERSGVQFIEAVLALQQVHLRERGEYARSPSELLELRPEHGPGARPDDEVTPFVRRLAMAWPEVRMHFKVELLRTPTLAGRGPHHCVVLKAHERARSAVEGGYFADSARHAVFRSSGPFEIDPETFALKADPASRITDVKDAYIIDWRRN